VNLHTTIYNNAVHGAPYTARVTDCDTGRTATATAPTQLGATAAATALLRGDHPSPDTRWLKPKRPTRRSKSPSRNSSRWQGRTRASPSMSSWSSASKKIDDDGDRVGGLHAFPRDGCQPVYITKGLLVHAIDTLRQQSSVE
jgi:hypothetical protein